MSLDFALLAGLLIFCLFVSCFSIYISRKNIANVFLTISIVFNIFYLGDGIYSIYRFESSNIFTLSSEVLSYDGNAVFTASILVAFCSLLLSVFTIIHRRPGIFTDLSRFRLNIPLISIISLVFSLTFVFVIYRSFGIAFYLNNISARALLFSSNQIVFIISQIAIILASISGASIIAYNNAKMKVFLYINIVTLMILFVFGGARAGLLKSAIIFALIYFISNNRFYISRQAVVLITTLGAIFVLYYNNFRAVDNANQYYYVNETVQDSIFNSVEVSQFDNIVIILQNNLQTPSLGYTIFPALYSFLPRAVMDRLSINKGEGGGAYFTSVMFPDRWERTQSELALGFIGDLVMNFGLLASVFILGGFLSLIHLISKKFEFKSSFSIMFYACFIIAGFQIVRGDFFNSSIGVYTFLLAVSICVITKSKA